MSKVGWRAWGTRCKVMLSGYIPQIPRLSLSLPYISPLQYVSYCLSLSFCYFLISLLTPVYSLSLELWMTGKWPLFSFVFHQSNCAFSGRAVRHLWLMVMLFLYCVLTVSCFILRLSACVRLANDDYVIYPLFFFIKTMCFLICLIFARTTWKLCATYKIWKVCQ